MSRKKQTEDYNLRDFTWEEEEFKFQPKENRHGKRLCRHHGCSRTCFQTTTRKNALRAQ